MKFAGKLFVAVAIGALCVALVVKDMDFAATWAAVREVRGEAVLIFLVTLAITHLFRAWRWKYLLRPIGVTLRPRDLLTISSVGFMAILALPVRLGEFVRPYFIVRMRKARMSAVLGTVAVERIIDGLLISVLFFSAYALSDEAAWPPVLRGAAWLSLLGFLSLTLFLVFALVWTEPTIRLALAVTFVSRLSPPLAHKIEDKLRSLVRGFRVLGDPTNLAAFLCQSALYWGVNGLGMWLLARSMNLEISVTAAYATMALTGVIISLPNAPGLLGQFHLGIKMGLLAYLPAASINGINAYGIVLHGLNVLWYVGVGFLALLFVPGGTHSLRVVVRESNRAIVEPEPETRGPASEAPPAEGSPERGERPSGLDSRPEVG